MVDVVFGSSVSLLVQNRGSVLWNGEGVGKYRVFLIKDKRVIYPLLEVTHSMIGSWAPMNGQVVRMLLHTPVTLRCLPDQ